MRVELLVKGIHPGPLFSSRDKTLREFLVKEKTIKSQELMVLASASTNNIDIMKTAFKRYSSALWYENKVEDREGDMLKYYNEHVKHLTPELYRSEAGVATVKGLT